MASTAAPAAKKEYALVQFFADGSNDEVGEYYSHLIPLERVPRPLVAVMTMLNGAVSSEASGDDKKMTKELDAFLETCKDCEIEGAVKLPPGGVVAVLCQTF